MDKISITKGEILDNLGELWWIKRLRIKTIPLLFGWKLVKEEKDKDYRRRILDKISS